MVVVLPKNAERNLVEMINMVVPHLKIVGDFEYFILPSIKQWLVD